MYLKTVDSQIANGMEHTKQNFSPFMEAVSHDKDQYRAWWAKHVAMSDGSTFRSILILMRNNRKTLRKNQEGGSAIRGGNLMFSMPYHK